MLGHMYLAERCVGGYMAAALYHLLFHVLPYVFYGLFSFKSNAPRREYLCNVAYSSAVFLWIHTDSDRKRTSGSKSEAYRDIVGPHISLYSWLVYSLILWLCTMQYKAVLSPNSPCVFKLYSLEIEKSFLS